MGRSAGLSCGWGGSSRRPPRFSRRPSDRDGPAALSRVAWMATPGGVCRLGCPRVRRLRARRHGTRCRDARSRHTAGPRPRARDDSSRHRADARDGHDARWWGPDRRGGADLGGGPARALASPAAAPVSRRQPHGGRHRGRRVLPHRHGSRFAGRQRQPLASAAGPGPARRGRAGSAPARAAGRRGSSAGRPRR